MNHLNFTKGRFIQGCARHLPHTKSVSAWLKSVFECLVFLLSYTSYTNLDKGSKISLRNLSTFGFKAAVYQQRYSQKRAERGSNKPVTVLWHMLGFAVRDGDVADGGREEGQGV